MSRDTTRRRFLAGGAAAALAAAAGCTGATPFVGQRVEETETIPADDVDTVSVETDTGSVTVRTADREDVRVEIRKQSSSVGVDVTALDFRTERRDGRLRMYSEWTGDEPRFGSRPDMDLDVTIPRSLALESVETTTGSVEITGTTGDLSVETTTGSIDVRDVEGTATASATTGSVTIRRIARLGDVTTSTGSIDVDVPALDGDVSITATTGSVTAALAPDLDADLRVSTTTGSVSIGDIDLDGGRREDDRVTGTLGDGGPRLTVETRTGSVTLERLG